MSKIKVHYITYLIVLITLLCGYFNYFFIISLILIIHDLGHIIILKKFKIKIYDINIFPFGSIINTKINYNLNSNILLLISIAGIIMQLFLYLILYFLFSLNFISTLSYNIFLTYNKLIIIFNIIPIIPLDGSKILLSVLERILSYKKALIISSILSLISIIIFIYFNEKTINLIIICIFLLSKTYEEILNHNYIFNRFLLERYLITNQNKKIKNITSIKNIYKNNYNFINNVSEVRILAKLFDN